MAIKRTAVKGDWIVFTRQDEEHGPEVTVSITCAELRQLMTAAGIKEAKPDTAADRMKASDRPTCDLCGTQHGTDADCADVEEEHPTKADRRSVQAVVDGFFHL